MMRILVTGGAGYIGGVFVRAALAAGHEIMVIDNLCTGFEDSLPPEVEFVRADIRETRLLDPLLARADAVVHFAALSIVGDSVADPVGYYRENLGSFLTLLDRIRLHGPHRLIFSSSAAVYGSGEGRPFDEGDPLLPVNPYGGTKLAMEQTLAHVAPALGLNWLALRYFNAAGAVPGHGERHDPETHLIPLALEAALGRRELIVFGRDYDTPDGTCIRDYIHVNDLARAHLAALTALDRGVEGVLNLGTGRGHSVQEVIDSVVRITGRESVIKDGARRTGDPAKLIAAVKKAEECLGWQAQYSDLDEIVASAWEWSRSLYKDRG
ncbi:MAG: UDP-glucose 4-epimerase GalE [bacterium]|nr:UDP-glucose 4-epimerase GalE [bacterium]